MKTMKKKTKKSMKKKKMKKSMILMKLDLAEYSVKTMKTN